MAGSIHAEQMLQYAREAATDPRPWERWEWAWRRPPEDDGTSRWEACTTHPSWELNKVYRRMPRVPAVVIHTNLDAANDTGELVKLPRALSNPPHNRIVYDVWGDTVTFNAHSRLHQKLLEDGRLFTEADRLTMVGVFYKLLRAARGE